MWLDLIKLARNLLRDDQELVQVKYFTSRIKNNPDKQKRQNLYLDALGALDSAILKICHDDYQSNDFTCWSCGATVPDQQEKQTDVNIATHMILDAMSKSKVDDLVLVTANSDQCPSVTAVRSMGKHVLAVLPPRQRRLYRT